MKTEGHGDCCMMTLLKWGLAKNESTENIHDFDDENHMNHTGKFTLQVNETCLSCDHKAFMLAPPPNPYSLHSFRYVPE